MSRDIVDQILTANFFNVFGGSKNGPSKGGPLIGDGMKVVKYHLLNLLVDFFHLTQNDTTFSLDLSLTEV